MSVRNSIKIITLVGAASMLPGVVSAATPDFGSWTATNGTSIAGCPTGFTCAVINSGDGFSQATVTEDADPTNAFIRTVITDVATGCNDFASCAFSDENFVKTDGTSNGIAGRQSTTDAALNFSGTVELHTGWAAATAPANVDINQSLSDNPDGTANNGDEFSTSFNLQVDLDGSGNQTGKSMTVSQDVGLGAGTTDNQVFEVREKSGTQQSTPGSSTLGGDTVTWASGDDVLVTWISQNVNIGTLGDSVFAFQAVENKTVPAVGNPASDFSTTSNDPTAAPFDWATGSDVETTFGTAP